MRIVLDTNSLFDDPVMVRAHAARVLELLNPARAILVFSPVVKAELERKRREEIDDLHETIGNRMRKLGRLAGPEFKVVLDDAQALKQAALDRWSNRWIEILSNPQVEFAEWPQVESRQVVEREIGRRRPFLDKEPGTIGHRDTLIWLGVVELAKEDPDDEIVFVTADKGFLGPKGLHPHLLEDLEVAGAEDCVTHITSLPALIIALQQEAENSGWESWREPAVAEALYEELKTLDAYDFVEHWDDRDGGTAAPTFDVGLPFTGHDWALMDIDGPQEVMLEDASYGADELLCTFEVDIYLSGFMEKTEWYSDNHPAVELWDADWNDQLVSIESERRVRFKAKLAIDDEAEVVVVEELLEARFVPDSGSVTLT